MSVVANRTGQNAVVTITTDISDILALVGVSNAEKKVRAFQKIAEELRQAIEAVQYPDAQLDQRIVEVTTQVAAVKAIRPTGTL